MINKKQWYAFVVLLSLCSYACADKDFIQSFVNHYDFSAQGRYTHEYHPFLLEKTRQSLVELESTLLQKGFEVDGRIMVMGYQQEGVPSYYSCYTEAVLDDEAHVKLQQGRTVSAHNIFGFLTGFLCKDINWFQQKLFPQLPLFVEHINPDCVFLFNDNAYLFQKHAFGENFNSILKERDRLERILKNRSLKDIVKFYSEFWQSIFDGEFINFNQEVLATQDILFSIGFARHLLQTKIPLVHMYVGPDITYPIQVRSDQKKEVTQNAQDFVAKITPTLIARENKKTVYVFCSFVDGVGKSTLLGNIINYAKHGLDVSAYQHVDNSSSQKATLYSLKNDVFILDLPAQLSHWVSKPDGYVFIDLSKDETTTEDEKNILLKIVNTHKKEYEIFFEQMLTSEKQHENFLYAQYVANIQHASLDPEWIPFVYNHSTYLFNKSNSTLLKKAVPLAGVQSHGLKVPHAEHMIFSKGLCLPMHYNAFVEDVVQQLHSAGIEKIVFIDFLSMYPRSSRENVRINFLIQQMQRIFPQKFSVEKSLYRNFVNHNLELYHALSTDEQAFAESLTNETIMRTALYRLFLFHSTHDVSTLSYASATHALQQEVDYVIREYGSFIKQVVCSKITQERKILEKYAHDKNYHIFMRFSFDPLCKLSNYIYNLCTRLPGELKLLWSNISTQNVNVLGAYNYLCKDQIEIEPLLRLVRAHWYAALANVIMVCKHTKNNVVMYPVAPIIVQKHENNVIVCQKKLESLSSIPIYPTGCMYLFGNFVDPEDVDWGKFNDQPYCLDWRKAVTSSGIYAYGFNRINRFLYTTFEQYQKDMKEQGFNNVALPTSDLKELLDTKNAWQKCQKKMFNDKVIIDSNSAQADIIRLLLRTLATIDMYIKDPQTKIIVRDNHQKDFAAALELLERITLCNFFEIVFSEPLFADYEAVKPVI